MILLLFVLLFGLMGVGFSIWTAMGLSGTLYLLLQRDVSMRIVVSRMVSGIDIETLIAIPFFLSPARS